MNSTIPRSSDVWLNGGPINRDTFDKAVRIGMEMQKRNPWGSVGHRKGFAIVREANIRFFGKDNLGDYESF